MAFDEDVALAYGNIRVELEQSGQRIGSHDMLIAAHAKSLNEVIVTNNVKEFERIKNLKVENWYK